MKSAKLAIIKPVYAVVTISDAIAAATYILTGEARNGRNVTSVVIDNKFLVMRGYTVWGFRQSHATGLCEKAPTFWQALHCISKKRDLDFSRYEVLTSEPLAVQYNSRKATTALGVTKQ